jgi:hypothetical protein
MIIATLACAPFTHANAQSLISEGHAAGPQCTGTDINNNGIAVGTCSSGFLVGPDVAYVALVTGTETSLPPLASGQSCAARGITNAGVIIGGCFDASNRSFGVIWNASNTSSPPVALAPFPASPSFGADVRTSADAYNQDGYIAGESVNASGNATAVLWAPGSASAVRVSNYGDNCMVAAVNRQSGSPAIVLNCPNANGTSTAEIAQAPGLPGAYALANLPLPPGATHCTVSGINDSGQAIGTCHFPMPDIPQTAYWATSTGNPTLLSNFMGGGARMHGESINNPGHAIVTFKDMNGKTQPAYWEPLTGVVQQIQPLPGGAYVSVSSWADNDQAAVNSETGGQTVVAALWTLAGGTRLLGMEGGGNSSTLSRLSRNGQYGTGSAETATGNVDAVVYSQAAGQVVSH